MADKDFQVKNGIIVGGDAFISNSITSVNTISFVTGQEFIPGTGSIAWNEADGTLSVGLRSEVSLQLGQENHYYVKNQTGSTILNNTVVMANGVLGASGIILVAPAIGDGSFPAEYIMGVATQDISNGDDGYVTSFGKVRGIDTSMFSEGDILYLDPEVPGAMMNTAPVAPNVKATIAVVIVKHANVGEILVRPTFADRMNELQDVAILDGIVDGESLVWVSANSRFENQTVSGGAGDEANLYNTYTTLTANDYATYTTLSGEFAANDYNSYTTLVGFINTVQDNVSAGGGGDASNAWVNANDYSTYTTLSSLIDTVQDNVSSSTSNTSIVAGGTDLSNTIVFVEAGDGVLLSSNTTSKTLTIATSMSNVTSQTIAIDGTANSFSLTKSASNSNMVLLMYNGLVQDPARYSISGSTLTLVNTAPLIAGANLEVRYFDFFSLPGVSESGGEGYTFQGSVSGYNSGGISPAGNHNNIDKFSFVSDANASDVGDLTAVKDTAAGQSSSTHGYTSGGNDVYVLSIYYDVIEKFPFSVDTNSTDVGDLTEAKDSPTGQSSAESGYTSGGQSPLLSPTIRNVIDKFPFSSDANASDVGDLTQARYTSAGQSSTSSGYTSGGRNPNATNTIDKFPFAADANATDVGDLTQARWGLTGQSSTTSGYSSGGFVLPNVKVNIIEKSPFATDANATDVGDLTQGRYGPAGQSSTSSGYTSGGRSPTVNTIDKFPFAADTNATDVGDLTLARYDAAGQQV